MSDFNRKIIIATSIAILIFFISSFFFKSSSNPISTENAKRGNEIVRNKKTEDAKKIREFQGSEDDFIELINKSRHEQGLPSLNRNEKLSQSATNKARDMGEKQYFEHVSSDGLQPWFFAEKQNYNYKNFGENLAEGFFSATSAHDSWMNSSDHRDNILSEEFEEVGIAIFGFEQNGFQSFLIVQHFGTELEPKDSLVITCSSKTKKHCKDAERKKLEIKDSIESQEKIVKSFKQDNVNNSQTQEAQENLEKLEEIKDDLKDYIRDCEIYIEKCEEWE